MAPPGLMTIPLELRYKIFGFVSERDVKPKLVLQRWFENQEVKKIIAEKLAADPEGPRPVPANQYEHVDSDSHDFEDEQADSDENDVEDNEDEYEDDEGDEGDNEDEDDEQDDEDEMDEQENNILYHIDEDSDDDSGLQLEDVDGYDGGHESSNNNAGGFTGVVAIQASYSQQSGEAVTSHPFIDSTAATAAPSNEGDNEDVDVEDEPAGNGMDMFDSSYDQQEENDENNPPYVPEALFAEENEDEMMDDENDENNPIHPTHPPLIPSNNAPPGFLPTVLPAITVGHPAPAPPTQPQRTTPIHPSPKYRHIPTILRLSHPPPPLSLFLVSPTLSQEAKSYYYRLTTLTIRATASFPHTSFFLESLTQLTEAPFSPLESLRKISIELTWDTEWILQEPSGFAKEVFPALLEERVAAVKALLTRAPDVESVRVRWWGSRKGDTQGEIWRDAVVLVLREGVQAAQRSVRFVVEEKYLEAGRKPVKKSRIEAQRREFQGIADRAFAVVN